MIAAQQIQFQQQQGARFSYTTAPGTFLGRTLRLQSDNNENIAQQSSYFKHQDRPQQPLAERPPVNVVSTELTNAIDETKSRGQSKDFRLKDSSQVITIVINGGPKWGFRIRQLNDGRVIVSRLDKGPAERSGLKVNDELLCVNNVPLGNNGPRSLLLHDYAAASVASVAASAAAAAVAAATGAPRPDRAQPASVSGIQSQADNAAVAASKAAAPNGSTGCEPLDLLETPATSAAAAMPFLGAGPSAGGSGTLELSKLDFAYQLIKHSSGSNKLILTVKRFTSAAYARASVAAASGLLSDHHRLSAANASSRQLPAASHQQQQQSSLARSTAGALARPLESLGWFSSIGAPPEKRAHTSVGQSSNYATYNCCECYCVQDNEGEWIIRTIDLFILWAVVCMLSRVSVRTNGLVVLI